MRSCGFCLASVRRTFKIEDEGLLFWVCRTCREKFNGGSRASTLAKVGSEAYRLAVENEGQERLF